MAEKDDGKKTVVFFHPDLGIGGAERLVVDAAVGLQNRGCKVVIFTSHCDKGHCFEEARDGTALPRSQCRRYEEATIDTLPSQEPSTSASTATGSPNRSSAASPSSAPSPAR